MTIEGVRASSRRLVSIPTLRPERKIMADPDDRFITSQALIAELNRSIDVVAEEIAARRSAENDAEATRRNRRFISAKAAVLSEASDIARSAARQLTDAKARILEEVARAEAAGFVVHEDFSVTDSISRVACSTRARDHGAAIRAAVTDFSVLDRRVSSRLHASAIALKDLSDN
jgi:hypothetical protein